MISLPNKKYNIIKADPPWHFKSRSEKGEGRNATQHYDCMSLKDICDMPVEEIADKDCVLFMWCTDPLLHKQIPLVEKWGFEYKTVGFTWAKTNKNRINNYFFKGPGYWTRANTETCILATKGKPGRLSKSVRQLIHAPRREHSRKPDEIYDRIEQLLPGPYVELFARRERKGWDSWGNEL